MKIISLCNAKGGCAKSTSATNIAAILEERGYKTLLIDTDLQCNSSDTYRAAVEGESTLYDVMLDEEDPISVMEAIQKTEIGDIVAADPLLREADAKLSSKGIGGFTVLKNALKDLKGYDFVIIDTAPAINMVLRNVLTASDHIIIPVTADRYGLQGMRDLNTAIRDTKQLNADINILGILLVKYNKRTRLSQDVHQSLEEIAKTMDTKLFNTTIRESTRAKEAQAERTTLNKYDKNATTALDYEDFVTEMLKEMGYGKKQK